jgi:hypothetical protein
MKVSLARMVTGLVARKRIQGLWIDREALRRHLGTHHQDKAREPIPFIKPSPVDCASYEEHFEDNNSDSIDDPPKSA